MQNIQQHLFKKKKEKERKGKRKRKAQGVTQNGSFVALR